MWDGPKSHRLALIAFFTLEHRYEKLESLETDTEIIVKISMYSALRCNYLKIHSNASTLRSFVHTPPTESSIRSDF